MANKFSKKTRKNLIRDESIEDTTMYGEFIPSFDQWITPDRQREVAKHLEKVTDVMKKDEVN